MNKLRIKPVVPDNTTFLNLIAFFKRSLSGVSTPTHDNTKFAIDYQLAMPS
jgi:hypothetical protein